MSIGPFGIEEPRLYSYEMTTDGKWLLRHFEDGKWIYYSATLYDSMEQAKEIADLLTARDMARYKAELAATLTKPKSG